MVKQEKAPGKMIVWRFSFSPVAISEPYFRAERVSPQYVALR